MLTVSAASLFRKIKATYSGEISATTWTFWSHPISFTWWDKSHKIEADGDSFPVLSSQIEIAKINIGPKLTYGVNMLPCEKSLPISLETMNKIIVD